MTDLKTEINYDQIYFLLTQVQHGHRNIEHVFNFCSPEDAFKMFFTYLRVNRELYDNYVKVNDCYIIQFKEISSAPYLTKDLSEEIKQIDNILRYMFLLIKYYPDRLYILINDWLNNNDIKKTTSLEALLLKMEYEICGLTKSRI